MENFTAQTLAECLFEMEGSSIYQDPDSHWWVNDWFHKYGDDSIKHHDFAYPEAEVTALANMITEDKSNNVLDSFEYEGGENYDYYTGFITNVFEKELASKTKVGFQLTLILN